MKKFLFCKKKIASFLTFVLLFSSCVLFVCCNMDVGDDKTQDIYQYIFLQNAQTKENKNVVSVKGKLISYCADETNQARLFSAFPALPVNIQYSMTAIDKNDATKTIQGTIKDNSGTFEYEVALPFGTWELLAQAKDKTDETKIFLEGKTAQDITVDETTQTSSSQDIILQPKTQTDATGSVSLKIETNASITGIASVFPSCSSCSDFSFDDTEQKLKANNIAVGTYNVTLTFKDATGQVLYCTTEVLNVFANMTTDTWQKESSPYIDSSGNFCITDSLVKQFLQTSFYVAPNSASPKGSDANEGSYFAPFETIQHALDAIENANKGDDTQYTIILKDNINAASEVKIKPTKKLNLVMQALDDTKNKITAASNERIITVDDSLSSTITFNGLTFTGGNTTEHGGAALISGGVITFNDCAVENNKATGQGGGIAIEGKAQVVIQGKSKVSSNVSQSSGGGIYLKRGANGTLKIREGVVLEGNSVTTSSSTGGAIRVEANNLLEICGTEAAPVVVKSNTAIGNAGGISLASSGLATTIQTTEKNVIDYCTFQDNVAGKDPSGNIKGGGGGALFLNSGATLESFCGNIFKDNKAFCATSTSTDEKGKGGAVYFAGDFYVISGYDDSCARNIVFQGNTATVAGNGVYVSKSTDNGFIIDGLVKIGDDTDPAATDDIYLENYKDAQGSVAGGNVDTAIIRIRNSISSGSKMNVTSKRATDETVIAQMLDRSPLPSNYIDYFSLLSPSSMQLEMNSSNISLVLKVIKDFYVSSVQGNDSNTGAKTSPFCSMQHAIDVIAGNDTKGIAGLNDGATQYTIFVDDNLTGENACFEIDTTNVLLLKICSSSIEQKTLDANAKDAVAKINATNTNSKITIENLEITGGSASVGGGIHILKGDVSITNCLVTKNKSTVIGGGISCNVGKAQIKNCTISQNTTAGNSGGGLMIAGSTVTLESCMIKENNITNTLAQNGLGVCLNMGTLKISGKTSIGNATDTNDVHLMASRVITLEDSLDINSYIRVTPNSAASGTVILKAENGVQIDSSICDKFHLQNCGDFDLCASDDKTQGILKEKTVQENSSLTIDDPAGYTLTLQGLSKTTVVQGGSDISFVISAKNAQKKDCIISNAKVELLYCSDSAGVAATTIATNGLSATANITTQSIWPKGDGYMLFVCFCADGIPFSQNIAVTLQ